MDMGLIITIVAFIFVALCLLTGKIPGSVACGTAVLVLWMCNVITSEEAFANFVSSSIVVMVCMMILIGALLKTDILNIIAGWVRKSKGGVMILLVATMVVPFFLCQFIGGVTAMITVIPLAIALAAEAGIASTVLVLPASVGAQAGLLALPIGGAAAMYMVKNQMMEAVGCTETLGFWDLCLARMPGTIAVFLFVLLVGWKLLPQRELGKSDMLENSDRALKKSTLSKGKQYTIYVIFIATMVMLSICNNLGISNMLVAMTAAILVMLLGFLNEREMFASINWSLIFMMSFMLSIATALGNSGASELLAGLLSPVYGSGNVVLAAGATFVFCAVLTQFMDNTALINILTPICVAACVQNGISAIPVVLAIDASCLVSFSTPMASPSSLVAYQLGGYSMKEMLKFNVPLILISSIVSIIWIPIYSGLIR